MQFRNHTCCGDIAPTQEESIEDLERTTSTPDTRVRPRDLVKHDRVRSVRVSKQRKLRDHEDNHGQPILRYSENSGVTPARRSRVDFQGSPFSCLGAGRIDPFNVYMEKDLPNYIQGRLDHLLHIAALAYLPSDSSKDLRAAQSQLMSSMADHIGWYSAMVAAFSHYGFVAGQPTLSHRDQLLCLSYRTKLLSLVHDDIRAHDGVASEFGIVGIATLMVHGDDNINRALVHDKVQESKAFGTANDMHYYSSVELDCNHWTMLSQCVQRRGGPSTIKLGPLALLLAGADVLRAWRTLSKPDMQPFVSTATALAQSAWTPDDVARKQLRMLLSGVPVGFRTFIEAPYARLYENLQHTRDLVARFDQWQRRQEREWRPDLMQIHFTRVLILYDLLHMLPLETASTSLQMTYELCRHACLAFMQLVLFPIAMNNDMPNQLLCTALPVLNRARVSLGEAALLSREERLLRADIARPTWLLFLWSWMLAGMLALEHFQTKGESIWMTELAPFLGDMPITVQKMSWATVQGAMNTFMWLRSECDSSGEQWWNYACLCLREKRRAQPSMQQQPGPIGLATLS